MCTVVIVHACTCPTWIMVGEIDCGGPDAKHPGKGVGGAQAPQWLASLKFVSALDCDSKKSSKSSTGGQVPPCRGVARDG